MTQRFENKGAKDVATFGEKMEYVSPEIEVINLDEQPKLLAGSPTSSYGASFSDIEDDEL